MLRSCLVLLCALTACAPATRESWLKRVSSRSEGLCWWRNARWEDRGPLLVRGTGQPFARARARWEGEQWKGATTTAVLRRSGPVVVLQGEWSGPGLVLQADVDASTHALFRAWQPSRLGPAGLLLKGGHLRVTDALTGSALVVPSVESLRPFQSEQPVALAVGCDALSLSAVPEAPGDPLRRLLALSGFPADAPERWVPENLVLAASAQAGGPTVGRFVSGQVPLRGFVVGQAEGEARLVVPTRGGTVWVGWVAAEGLEEPTGEPSPAPLRAPVVNAQAPRTWRSCPDSELPVSIQSEGGPVEVGSLQPDVAFAVAPGRGDYREATLAVEWLELEPHVRLLLPARAAECPRLQQLGSW